MNIPYIINNYPLCRLQLLVGTLNFMNQPIKIQLLISNNNIGKPTNKFFGTIVLNRPMSPSCLNSMPIIPIIIILVPRLVNKGSGILRDKTIDNKYPKCR